MLLFRRPRLDYLTQRSTHEDATRQAAVASPATALPLLSTSHLTPTTTPLRPITPIHTRALSTRDLFLRLSDHCNAHCPPATRLHDIFQLSELYSWIALHQLQPALDTLPPYTAYRIALGQRCVAYSDSTPRISAHPYARHYLVSRAQSTKHHIQNTPSGTGLCRRQLLTSRPHTVGQFQPDWWPTTLAVPNAG